MSFLQGTGGTNLLTAITLGSKLLKGIGQFQEGRAEADVFEFNAKIKQEQAAAIRARSAQDLEVQRESARRRTATAEAQFIGGGVLPPVNTMIQIAENEEQSILINQYNDDIDEFIALSEASLQLKKAQSARTAGFIQAGSTIIGALPLVTKFKFPQKVQRKPSGSTAKGLRLQLEEEGALAGFG